MANYAFGMGKRAKALVTIEGATPRHPALALSPDGKRAVVSGGPGFVCVMIDLETRKKCCPFAGHAGPVHAIASRPMDRDF